jgi:hypothetical protein
MLIVAIVFLLLFIINAPYGRHVSRSWGFAQSPQLKESDDRMSEMIAVVRTTRSHCPVYIVTRWFSHENSLSWLLEHKQIVRTLDLNEMNAASSKKTARAMNAENFAKLKMPRSIIIPFTKCARYFEGDDISVAFVVPVLAHLKWFLNGVFERGLHQLMTPMSIALTCSFQL